MKRIISLAGMAAFGTLGLLANEQPTSTANAAYSPSHVQAHLRLNIREDADTVHFIRDTNDPKIITKTYVLKNADPYSLRPYIREMVQALRVDYNNPAGRSNPAYYNTYNKDNLAGTEKMFVPTGVECIRFSDGTGVIMVAAEDYRFQDSTNGMGIDSLINKLDAPNLMNSSGQPKYIYFPANRSAKELQTMIKLVGANVSNDTVELIGGKDKIEVDEDLNCLFMNTALYSRKNIEEMLRIYDVALPEIRISCTVYELGSENDGMLGLDFQSWKNNDGVKFFSTGANLSRNYNLNNISIPIDPSGTINTHYFNFEPKWNTRFLDFLVSKGKAKVFSTADIAVRNGATGNVLRKSGTLYAASTKIPATDKSGNIVEVKTANDKFKFQMNVTPSITEKAATVQMNVSTVSLIGFDSSGTIRTSAWESNQKVMLGTGRNRLYLGGIEKTEVVSDQGGVPFLKDLPLLGFLFSTERESTKKSNLVVVAECEIIQPNSLIDEKSLEKIKLIKKDTNVTGEWNKYGYHQYLIDSERSE